MNKVAGTLVAVAALGALGGASVVFFGLFNTSAQSGHWSITNWVLHTTFENSVALRAPPPSQVPELTEAMARLGVRHYDAACKPCHAAPGLSRTATMAAMLPAPPHISRAVAPWSPNELGWIVREGVKMSGMPGWPASREDEMWSVVAFLTRVPEMDAGAYRDLTAAPELPGDAPPALAYCAGCHGAEGLSGNPHIPRLDIQGAAYLTQALRNYLDGTRESGIMAHAASEVAPEDLPALAAWFAGQRPDGDGAGEPVDPELAERGEALAHAAAGDPEVPACQECHGPEADPTVPGGPGPAIAGQYRDYLATQLRLWRAGTRGGGPRAELMAQAAEHLTDADIDALSAYYAGLAPEPPAE
jgi:cytochrome c553